MAAPRIIRAFVRALAVAVMASILLGLVPPIPVGAEPPVVHTSVPMSLEDLVPDRAVASRAGPGVATSGRSWTEPAVRCAQSPFTMVGLTWRQDGNAPVLARLAWGHRGRFGSPIRLAADPDEGPDPDSADDSGLVGTPPQWVGGAECVRVRLRLEGGERYRDLRASFIDTSGRTADQPPGIASAMATLWGMAAPSPAEAMPQKPPVIRRDEWGANESLRDKYCDGEPNYAPALEMAYVHHTAGSNDYSKEEADDVVRGIYSYHVNSLHYCDIAYNFLIDRFGRVFEGRYGGMTKPVIGAHASGFNTGSTGVATMGNFVSEVPPKAVRNAYKRLLAWRLDIAHLPPKGWTTMVSAGGSTARYSAGEEVRLRIISGHRDTSYTACPGAELYERLAGIRGGASNRGGPKIWNPRQTKPEIEPGQKVRWVADLSDKLHWSIEVQNATGAVVRRFSGKAGQIDRKWYGKSKSGTPVPAGTYTVLMEARYPGGKVARPARFTLRIV
jgi:hypothetical protein